jgi:segregation and condensation protein B
MENLEQKLGSLEALLFIHGEPVSYKKIESVLGLEAGECEALVAEMKKRLETGERGLQLVLGGEKAQLATKPEFNVIVENFVKEELSEDLTPASLEALSIIAYLGPISRPRIEYLRGVNSLTILRTLMMRGLVERVPDTEHPGGYLFQATFDLMRQLGLQGKEDLPDYAKFQELLKVFEPHAADAPPASPSPVTPSSTPPSDPLPSV